MGANIYPEDIEQALYDEPELASITTSFCLGLDEDVEGMLRSSFSFAVRGDLTTELKAQFDRRIVARVQAINADFQTAMREDEQTARPTARLFQPGTGPFASDSKKIKQTRIAAT